MTNLIVQGDFLSVPRLKVLSIGLHSKSHQKRAVDQAGLERTEAGESALPAEESPQPGRAKRKL